MNTPGNASSTRVTGVTSDRWRTFALGSACGATEDEDDGDDDDDDGETVRPPAPPSFEDEPGSAPRREAGCGR